MTKMLNDGRACTAAVNDMMAQAQERRWMPEMMGERQFIKFGLIFGHYDSRGGACLLADPNIINGMRRYNEACGWEPDDNCAFEDLQNCSQGHIEIAVVGGELTEGELLHNYSDEGGFVLFRVETRYDNKLQEDGNPDWTDWQEQPWAVLVKLTEEQQKKLDDFYNEDGDEENGKLLMAEVLKDVDFVSWDGGVLRQQYRFTEWDVGEDACGLCNLGV